MSDEMNVQTKGLNKKVLVFAIALILVGLVVALVLLLPASTKAKKVEEQLELGAKYLSELNYEQAITTYEAVIKIDPKCEEAYLALVDIYIATGAFEEAEGILKRAEIEIGVDVTDAVADKKKDVEKAREEQKKAESAPSPTSAPASEPTASPIPSPTKLPTLTPTNVPEPSPTSTPTPSPTSTPAPSPTPKEELIKRYESKREEVKKNGIVLYYYSITYLLFKTKYNSF